MPRCQSSIKIDQYYDVLIQSKSFKDIVIHCERGGFDLAPSNRNLAGAEVELVNESKRETRLKEALQHLKKDYELRIFLKSKDILITRKRLLID